MTMPDDCLATIADGAIRGARQPGGVRAFLGLPFAAPPVGALRWRAPQPPRPWAGVRAAERFGPRAMQQPVFGDMNFRSAGMSEDCLYLNVWAPDVAAGAGLPVLVYFYGGGFVAGDGSEPRYDGAALARRGIVAVTANYRLGAFGFLAHPELSAESAYGGSGNYAFLDQLAALGWVRQNIAAFGGDPGRVTVAGESAGSISVSALMASPLGRGLFAGAIGSSGSLIGTLEPAPLDEAEACGLAFAQHMGAGSLAELRALPAAQILAAAESAQPGGFPIALDGHVLPQPADAIFAAGAQARVPLLVGWNSEEANYTGLLGPGAPTRERYARALREHYGAHADALMRAYPAHSDDEVAEAAGALAADLFIGFSTWRWCELHGQTGGRPVYRYLYAHPRPAMRPEMGDAVAGLAGGLLHGEEAAQNRQPPPRGAVHSADIEYAMGNLDSNLVYAWGADDYAVSELLQACYVNFVRAGDPNGPGVPAWPAFNGPDGGQVMWLDAQPQPRPEAHRERYLLLTHIADGR